MGKDACPICQHWFGDEDMRNIYLSESNAKKLNVKYHGNTRVCYLCFEDKIKVEVL